MRSMCLMWCGSNEASEWFTIWTMSDERQETMVLYLRIWHFDSIPFFSSIEFIGIQWNQQNIQIYIHQLTHTHKNTLTLVVLLLDSNKFDKIFKFPWASAWHQIRISYQTARSFDSYSEKCKCSKAQCLLIHTHTFFANRWLISVVDVMCRFFHFSIEMQLNWCANFRLTHSQTYHRNPEW